MGLVCEMSPVLLEQVFVKIRQAKSSGILRSTEQLEGVGISDGWLDHAILVYHALGELHLAALSAGGVDGFGGLDSDHARLASWIFAPGRSSGDPTAVEGEIDRNVRATYDTAKLDTPLNARLVLHAWTVGHEASKVRPRYPAIPAWEPMDPEVALAYGGLIPHLQALLPMSMPLPEVATTSVVWRICALVDGLIGAESVQKGFSTLLGQVRRVLPHYEFVSIGNDCRDLGEDRNALTHLGAGFSGRGFVATAPAYQSYTAVESAVKAVTVFVFDRIADELMDQDVRRVTALVDKLTSALIGLGSSAGLVE